MARTREEAARKDSPFENLPDKRSGENWHWMKPELVIQVAFQDWTQGGSCASRVISACARIAIRKPWCAKNRRIPRTW